MSGDFVGCFDQLGSGHSGIRKYANCCDVARRAMRLLPIYYSLGTWRRRTLLFVPQGVGIPLSAHAQCACTFICILGGALWHAVRLVQCPSNDVKTAPRLHSSARSPGAFRLNPRATSLRPGYYWSCI